jgi:BirA family biotin operon repressor/biotin-[acetyl-CoA-carboxylase] ligase
MNHAALAHALGEVCDGATVDVEVLAVVASSNDALLARCRQQRPVRPLLLAVARQTAGRGRQRRAWQAPRDALLFSLAVPLTALSAALPAVTLAVGAELAEVLAARGVETALKWPNDVLLNGRKLAGILCELAIDSAGGATLVIGVGVNVALAADEAAHIGQPAAALADVLPPAALTASREAWIAALAAAALAAVQGFERDGFAAWRERFNARLHGRGVACDILEDGTPVAHGRIVEVDGAGRLVLEGAAGRCSIQSGDLSLRMAAP